MKRLDKKYKEAIALRKKGFSLTEIHQKLKISKSTASLWLKNIELDNLAIERLVSRSNLGRVNSARIRKARVERFEKILKVRTEELIRTTPISKNYQKIICASLFWCEGGKNTKAGIQFTNSDPLLIKAFISLLRSSFNIKEEKFRVSLHLHEYHNTERQIKFWSKITNIPENQFIKPYKKPNTKKRIKENYPGCVNLRYYNSALAKEICLIAKELFINIGA